MNYSTETLLSWLKNPGAFARNVATTFLVQVITLIVAFTYTAIIARWFGSEGKGMLELALLLPAMLGLFLSGGIGVANVYYAGSRRLDVPVLTANSVTFAILATLLGFTLVSGLVLTGWAEILLPDVPAGLLLLAMLVLPIELFGGFFRTILQGTNRILAANLVNLLKIVALLALTLLLVGGLKMGLRGALYASLGAGVIHLIPLVLLLRQQMGTFTPRWNKPVMRTTLLFGIRGHIGNVLQFYNYRLDLFLVNYFLGPAGVGLYTVAVRMAETLWFLPNAVGFVILPKAAGNPPNVMNAFTPRVFRITLGITVAGAIGLALVGRPVIILLFTSEFAGAYLPLLALLPGVALLGGAKVLTNEIMGRGYPHYNSINAALALVVTVILDLLLIPRLGILGAALASTITYTFTFVIAIVCYLIVSRKRLSGPPITDREPLLPDS